MSRKDFDKFLLETVDEGLSSIGESSKQASYFYLEKAFKFRKDDVLYKIEDFACAIEIFGLGADFLEILIMKNLYEKVGRTVHLPEPKDFVFTEYVAATERGLVGIEKS
jgi:hypothetical protein